MRGFRLVTAAIAYLVFTPHAWASYVEVKYSGTVGQVSSSVPSPVALGAPITFDVVFDPSKLVDYTAGVNAAVPSIFPSLTTPNFFSSVRTASLSDDPFASLTITLGPVTFTKFDEANYGNPCGDTPLSQCSNPTSPTGGLGAGNLPDVEYLNGSFSGVGNLFVNAQGYTLDADPIADALQRASSQGRAFRVMSPGDFDFVLSKGTFDSPFAQKLAAGNININSMQISAVPEPTSWALLLPALVTLLGGAVLRKHAWRSGGGGSHGALPPTGVASP